MLTVLLRIKKDQAAFQLDNWYIVIQSKAIELPKEKISVVKNEFSELTF